MKLKDLSDVVRYDLCAGCGICESVAGRENVCMEIDAKGFLRPVIRKAGNQKWEIIRKVCPGVFVNAAKNKEATKKHVIWGPYHSFAAGEAVDEEFHWKGASGGVITALAYSLIQSGRADAILQIGADPENACRNKVFLNKTREEIVRCAGSRYAPSAPLVDIKNILRTADKRYAIIGKPCDIAALNNYLGAFPELSSRIVCTLSFFCGGVPSQHATGELLSRMGVISGDVMRLRYRGFGWPGKVHADLKIGGVGELDYQTAWGKILGRSVQFRCKICADAIGISADIVCGDAWHSRGGEPDFSEHPGRSFLFCRTLRGEEILKRAENNGFVKLEAYDLDNLKTIQRMQFEKRSLISARLFALKFLGKPSPAFLGLGLREAARKATFSRRAHSFLGAVKRIIKREVL